LVVIVEEEETILVIIGYDKRLITYSSLCIYFLLWFDMGRMLCNAKLLINAGSWINSGVLRIVL